MSSRGMRHRSTHAAAVSSHDGPIMSDVLAVIPDLLDSCLVNAWASRGDGIRCLRLVSKEVGRTALTAVQSCTVDLGRQAYHSPEQVAKLMSCARLERLQLNISIDAPGYPASATGQQLSTCIKQVNCLLSNMRVAILHITHLTVNVQGPADVPEVSRSVGAMLAPAVPHLRHLRLSGAFLKHVALSTFAAHCPQLTHLEIEVCEVPVGVLQGIHVTLPNLSHLSLYSLAKGTTQGAVQGYIDSLLPLLENCGKLTVLELSLAPAKAVESDFTLKCKPELWDLLPFSLHELRCDVKLSSLLEATGFISRVTVLTLNECPAMKLAQLLDCAPQLQRIEVTSPGAREVDFLLDKKHLSTEAYTSLKARFQHGFQLSCPSVYVFGPSESIRDLISWLPLMQTTSALDLYFPGGPRHEDCLDGLGDVFPNLKRLNLRDDSHIENPVLCAQGPFLASLKGCRQLQQLALSMKQEFTHAGLVKFCLSIPTLCELAYKPREGLCPETVMSQLSFRGRHVLITHIGTIN